MTTTTTGRFTAETRYDASASNQRRIVQVVKCEECGEEHEFRVNTKARGGMPDAVIIKKLKGLGWEVKRGGRVTANLFYRHTHEKVYQQSNVQIEV